MDYIILSPDHGSPEEPSFWRAHACGYTNSPFAAGRYKEETIKSDLNYYNNGINAVAIPLTDKAMEQLGFKCQYDEKAIKGFLNKSFKNKPTVDDSEFFTTGPDYDV